MILQNVKLNWCKLLGAPRPNYAQDGFEWTVDVVLDDAQVKELQSMNIGDYIKEKDGVTFIKMRRNAEKYGGGNNDPIPVLDRYGDPWDESVNIGNGSTADIQFLMNEMSRGKNKGKAKPVLLKVKINELVEYAGGAGDGFSFDKREAVAADGDW